MKTLDVNDLGEYIQWDGENISEFVFNAFNFTFLAFSFTFSKFDWTKWLNNVLFYLECGVEI